MTTVIQHTIHAADAINTLLEKSYTMVALLARGYITQVFFQSGLTKLQDWDTTLFLFEEEYQVPLLSPTLSAYLGTFGEILFPILLFVGFATRFSALALFVVNVVAVISLESIAPAALYLHVIWGILLAQLAIHGGGAIAVERLIPAFRVHPPIDTSAAHTR